MIHKSITLLYPVLLFIPPNTHWKDVEIFEQAALTVNFALYDSQLNPYFGKENIGFVFLCDAENTQMYFNDSAKQNFISILREDFFIKITKKWFSLAKKSISETEAKDHLGLAFVGNSSYKNRKIVLNEERYLNKTRGEQIRVTTHEMLHLFGFRHYEEQENVMEKVLSGSDLILQSQVDAWWEFWHERANKEKFLRKNSELYTLQETNCDYFFKYGLGDKRGRYGKN